MSTEKRGHNFFDFLASLFFSGAHKEEKNKAKTLKRIAQDIKRSGLGKFYNASAKMLMPPFASYMYSIYMYTRDYLLRERSGKVMEQAVIRYFLNSAQQEALEKISLEYIKELQQNLTEEVFQKTYIKNMDMAQKIFTPSWMNNVNAYYNLITRFSWIADFDYYSLLKLFDGTLQKGNFFTKANFTKVRSFRAAEYIKDFLAVAGGLKSSVDWHSVFDILSSVNTKKLDIDNWFYVVNCIEKLEKTGVLENIVKHTTENPYWENTKLSPKSNIASAFVTGTIEAGRAAFTQAVEENRKGKLDMIIREIYGDAAEDTLPSCCYNEQMSQALKNSGFNGFIYIDAINHAHQFLSSFFSDIKYICDTFIIHGEWALNENRKLLSTFMSILTSGREELMSFYYNFSAEGKNTQKIKQLLNEILTTPSRKEDLRKYLSDINIEAGKIMAALLSSLEKIKKITGDLHNEQQIKQLKIIINWKALEPALARASFSLGACERKIADFLLLLNWNAAPGNPPPDTGTGRQA